MANFLVEPAFESSTSLLVERSSRGPADADYDSESSSNLVMKRGAGLSSEEPDLSFLGPSSRKGALGRIGEYEVLEILGRGGMGIVLKAWDTTLNRTVAVKVQHPKLAGDPRSRDRFLAEARAAAAINHPNVVTIHAVNQSPDRPYLVMEFVEGESLRERIKDRSKLDPAEVTRIALQMADGLAAAHAQGVLHRDIKPANILLEDGARRVKISDFGLALADLGAAAANSPDGVVGTLPYMSPEQVRNEPLDARSDLFSLGCVLYAMTSGSAPFRGGRPEDVIAGIQKSSPRPPHDLNPAVPRPLSDVVMRLLQKAPKDRHASAVELGQALRAMIKPQGAAVSRRSVQPPARGEPRHIDQIRVGELSYPLRRPLAGDYRPRSGGVGEFRVPGVKARFVGRGRSLPEARENWEQQVHIAFQQLLRKRPFERTEAEAATWDGLAEMIDVEAFERESALVFTETGRISEIRPGPVEIRWWPSDRSESLPLSSLPPDVAAFPPGQWFEAVVERDRETFGVRRVRYVQPIEEIRPLSDEDLEAAWKSFEPTTVLPRSPDGWNAR